LLRHAHITLPPRARQTAPPKTLPPTKSVRKRRSPKRSATWPEGLSNTFVGEEIRATFGRDAAIQRCQIHKARNVILDRLPKSMHASVRRVLRQAWEMNDADKAETLLRNLARCLEKDWEGVSASILEGLDEMLTVTRLGLPPELRRSLACTIIIENVMGTLRRVCRNVRYWRSPSMALRWAGAAMQEAAKGFRRLKAHKRLPLLKAALAERKARAASANRRLAQTPKAA
jgi:putative transposase